MRVGVRSGKAIVPLAVAAAAVVSCVVLGGSTRPGFVSDVALQLAAIALISILVLSAPDRRHGRWDGLRGDRLACLVVLAVLTLPLIQLVPLPPDLWMRLPGRSALLESLAAQDPSLASQAVGWRPISISPERTWAAWLSLLPPLAVFLAVVQLSFRERRLVVGALVLLGVVSVIVGLLQVAQGQRSAWRFFEITNPDDAVGFFANRNHLAALLYCCTAFASVWLIDVTDRLARVGRSGLQGSLLLICSATFLMFVVLVAGQLFSRSRAGIILTIVVLVGVGVMAAMMERRSREAAPGSARPDGWSTTRAITMAIGIALLIALQFSLYRVLGRFEADPLADARITFAGTTIAAAATFFPFGSGFGTFMPVFALFEPPASMILDIYANRAHNDVLELWLEAGVAGAGLVVAVAVWVGLRLWRVWRSDAVGSPFDANLMRAAGFVVLALGMHSLVDYPLRTAALMAVFATGCALLIPPVGTSDEGGGENPVARQHREPSRHRRQRAELDWSNAGGPIAAVRASATHNWPAASAPRRADHGAPVRRDLAGAWAAAVSAAAVSATSAQPHPQPQPQEAAPSREDAAVEKESGSTEFATAPDGVPNGAGS